jgi:hypothetical protein
MISSHNFGVIKLRAIKDCPFDTLVLDSVAYTIDAVSAASKEVGRM